MIFIKLELCTVCLAYFNVVQYDNTVINNNHPPAWISQSHQGGKQVIYNWWPNVIKLFCKSVQYNSHLSVLVMIWYHGNIHDR